MSTTGRDSGSPYDHTAPFRCARRNCPVCKSKPTYAEWYAVRSEQLASTKARRDADARRVERAKRGTGWRDG